MTIKSVCNRAFKPGRPNASLGVERKGFIISAMDSNSIEKTTKRRIRIRCWSNDSEVCFFPSMRINAPNMATQRRSGPSRPAQIALIRYNNGRSEPPFIQTYSRLDTSRMKKANSARNGSINTMPSRFRIDSPSVVLRTAVTKCEHGWDNASEIEGGFSEK